MTIASFDRRKGGGKIRLGGSREWTYWGSGTEGTTEGTKVGPVKVDRLSSSEK